MILYFQPVTVFLVRLEKWSFKLQVDGKTSLCEGVHDVEGVLDNTGLEWLFTKVLFSPLNCRNCYVFYKNTDHDRLVPVCSCFCTFHKWGFGNCFLGKIFVLFGLLLPHFAFLIAVLTPRNKLKKYY